MNSHGGNVAGDRRGRPGAARALRACSRSTPAGMRSAIRRACSRPEERAHGIHGGDAETSLMLAFRPQTVRMSEAQNFVSSAVGIEKDFKRLRVTQPIAIGWMSNDLQRTGRGGRRLESHRREGRGLRRERASRVSSSCCATCTPSTSPASATGRSAASSGPALVAVGRAHGDLPAR